MKIAEYIEKNTAALPPKLADILLQDTSIWTNDACYGYCIIAMKNAGYSRKKIENLLPYLHSAYENYAVEEAEEKWINFWEDNSMKAGTYIDIFCADCDTTEAVKNTIAATYHPEGMVIRGNELLIPVPENHGMGFSLNQLRSLVSPCRVEMFDLEEELDGKTVRWWY